MIVIFVIIAVSTLLIYFYPVTEVSGIISDYTCFCYKIKSNGMVDYYVGYPYDILEKEPEEFDFKILGNPYHTQKRLNIFQKLVVNEYVKNIKEKGSKSDKLKTSIGSGEITTYNCIIEKGIYNSLGFFEPDTESLKNLFDINLASLSLMMWTIKPDKCIDYWDFEKSAFPKVYVKSESGVVEINELNYKDILRDWSAEMKTDNK